MKNPYSSFLNKMYSTLLEYRHSTDRLNKVLNKEAILTAEDILKTHRDNKTAKWIANDALRELKSSPVQKRLDR